MSARNGICMKFWNPVTGRVVKINVNRIRHNSQGKRVEWVSMEATVTHMNANGYVRAGTRQVLNNTEKLLIADAGAQIEKLRSLQHA